MFVIAIVLAIEAILGFGTFAVAVAFWPWIGSHQPLTADQLENLSRSAAWSFLEGPFALLLGWIGKQFLTG